MFRYFYRILDKYQKPVSAVAIFTGLDGKKMPDQYLYQYQKTRLLYEYDTLSILDFTDQELEKSNNPFAMVMLAAKTSLLEGKIPELELLDRKILIANKLFRKGFSAKKIRAIFTFLEGYVLFEDRKMNRTFREQVKSNDKKQIMGIDEYIKMVAKEEGLEEGLEEGRTQTKLSVVKNLLAQTDFSDDKIANIAGVSVDVVEEVRNGKK